MVAILTRTILTKAFVHDFHIPSRGEVVFFCWKYFHQSNKLIHIYLYQSGNNTRTVLHWTNFGWAEDNSSRKAFGMLHLIDRLANDHVLCAFQRAKMCRQQWNEKIKARANNTKAYCERIPFNRPIKIKVLINPSSISHIRSIRDSKCVLMLMPMRKTFNYK